jgi:acetate kinase
MASKILVLNSGSSSLKYRLFDLEGGCRVLTSGLIERIGERLEEAKPSSVPDHRQAIAELVRRLEASGDLRDESELCAIGHRVVHGGETFKTAVYVDETVVEAIRAAIPLAPLHNPPNLLGIEVCRERWPDVPQVAVFDTAFHQSMPPEAYRYALPEECYRTLRIRRYGFHGTSFAYLTRRVAEYLARAPESLNLIALHLGNGASAAAIRAGRSVDTSMGLTPLAGLMMGTRCGDLDPGAVLYLLEAQGQSAEKVARLLNEDSGLKGVAGSNDMRDIVARAEGGEGSARLGIAMYVYRIRKYVGAYLAVLGRVDALVFSGGIGEHAAIIRREACGGLEHLGFVLDEAANIAAQGDQLAEIQSPSGAAKILVVPTDEELEIARQAARVVAELAGEEAVSSPP